MIDIGALNRAAWRAPWLYDTFDPILSEKEYTAWAGISAPTAQRQRSDGRGRPSSSLASAASATANPRSNGGWEARTINRVGALISVQQAPPSPASRAERGCSVSASAGKITVAVTAMPTDQQNTQTELEMGRPPAGRTP